MFIQYNALVVVALNEAIEIQSIRIEESMCVNWKCQKLFINPNQYNLEFEIFLVSSDQETVSINSYKFILCLKR